MVKVPYSRRPVLDATVESRVSGAAAIWELITRDQDIRRRDDGHVLYSALSSKLLIILEVSAIFRESAGGWSNARKSGENPKIFKLSQGNGYCRRSKKQSKSVEVQGRRMQAKIAIHESRKQTRLISSTPGRTARFLLLTSTSLSAQCSPVRISDAPASLLCGLASLISCSYPASILVDANSCSNGMQASRQAIFVALFSKEAATYFLVMDPTLTNASAIAAPDCPVRRLAPDPPAYADDSSPPHRSRELGWCLRRVLSLRVKRVNPYRVLHHLRLPPKTCNVVLALRYRAAFPRISNLPQVRSRSLTHTPALSAQNHRYHHLLLIPTRALFRPAIPFSRGVLTATASPRLARKTACVASIDPPPSIMVPAFARCARNGLSTGGYPADVDVARSWVFRGGSSGTLALAVGALATTRRSEWWDPSSGLDASHEHRVWSGGLVPGDVLAPTALAMCTPCRLDVAGPACRLRCGGADQGDVGHSPREGVGGGSVQVGANVRAGEWCLDSQPEVVQCIWSEAAPAMHMRPFLASAVHAATSPVPVPISLGGGINGSLQAERGKLAPHVVAVPRLYLASAPNVDAVLC
ncbi:hypothetical protein C8F04DRAFT_1198719 [Mycena alexandri]|uniref:Uncharacterized protein n=1 Tax=Mycena alexandri TaxID=1745969 RepID=A0AAD6S0L4_9AGAR|nr:hypothetical protein C8F04DRAFT_1198719 [Mycena alexandri]